MMTYTIEIIEIRADNKKTKSVLRKSKIKSLREIVGYTKNYIRQECDIQNIVKWGM